MFAKSAPASDRSSEAGPSPQEHIVMTPASDIAFSPTVKSVQERRGSRSGYARMEKKGGFATAIDANLAGFIAGMRSFYLATASKEGQPYMQHRGGPAGFLRVLDEKTLAFADFSGNRQYITTGNLAENPKAMIFLMDYQNRQRVKIWGTARVVENDPELNARLFPEGYRARAEAAILFTVEAWDANCPQHIPQMLFAEDVAEFNGTLNARIRELEAENARLRSAPLEPHSPLR
jgi:predicted pyridoxine 5'-phosphate oxidase superfamily flavin-nucleotide-binding protein